MDKLWTLLVVKSGMKHKDPPKQFDVAFTYAATSEGAVHSVAKYEWPAASGWVKGKSRCQVVKVFDTPSRMAEAEAKVGGNLVPTVRTPPAPAGRRRRRRRTPSSK